MTTDWMNEWIKMFDCWDMMGSFHLADKKKKYKYYIHKLEASLQ